MRQLIKGSAIIAVCFAVTGLAGCATVTTEEFNALKSRVDQLERTANDALSAANRAQSSADSAQSTAENAEQLAKEAVASVTRMAESCCRK